ncbi:MAG: hypothetical protein IKS32_07240 [Solobacterium sp.]|nr:hypothetical protein [Solobacterium sp.]
MLLFSAILETEKQFGKEDFINLVLEWNRTSTYPENIIPGIRWKGEHRFMFGSDQLWMASEESVKEDILAIRFEKKDNEGSVWDTDYVVNFRERRIAIRLDRSYTEEASDSEMRFSSPHFITLLEEKGVLKKDEDLAVSRNALRITEANAQMIAALINGTKSYRLPVIYVSRTIRDEDPVDVGLLASRLKGIAHVLAQESVSSNPVLRRLCDDRNEYFGAIGIFYPGNEHRRFVYRSQDGTDTLMMERVIQNVLRYSNSLRCAPLYTWQGVRNAVLMDRLEEQLKQRKAAEEKRKAAESEAQRLISERTEVQKSIRVAAAEEARLESEAILEAFDNDLQKLQKQTEELMKANEALQYENQRLKMKLDAEDGACLLNMGEEEEFFPDEIRELILSVLEDSLSAIPENTRRYDVTADILKHNGYTHRSQKTAEKIKLLLKDYSGMNAPLRQALSDLGFSIHEDGKHWKLVYYGDGRYQTVFAKTPSDKRHGGKNNAQNIIRLIL